QALRQSGLAARAGDRYPEAIADLEKAVVLDPDNLSGHVLLGWTLHLAGQSDTAKTALKQALKRDPTHIPALNALGIVYLVAGNLPEAIATHQQALSLKSDNEIARYNLSLAFHRLQDYNQAILNAEAATTLEPHNPHPWVALAIAHWDKGDKAAAQAAYQQATALDARYRDRPFLAHLKNAGFAPAQIQTTQQILENH
ncbi:MAG: tetratricopeptide repeat protein, partial [Chloroflexaceae bacterium]|nr:tetratricopeptide repeat protein [Chloroflexaceae bacterium]